MCGIFACSNSHSDELKNPKSLDFDKIKHRGPEKSNFLTIDNVKLGFHRLAINDLSDTGMQPFHLNGMWLICNGEVFNHKELERKYNFKMQSRSDCEVILHLYNYFKEEPNVIELLINELDAEFVFVIYDSFSKKMYAARDQYGIRPLFYGFKEQEFFFASEMKALSFLPHVDPFPPATYAVVTNDIILKKYYEISLEKLYPQPSTEIIHKTIKNLLTESVNVRIMSDKPVGAFLSGGVDSSLICALLIKQIPDLHCFTIGLDDNSVDILAAKKVAKHIGIKEGHHRCIYFTVEEGFAALKDVIYHLESWDTTTNRASVPQYLLAKYIKENTDIKVLYSGEFADETFASYQYFKLAPTVKDLELDTKRLLEEIYLYDGLRVDRTVSAFGLECRIPFGNKKLIDYIFSLTPELRICSETIIEKKLLRDSFKSALFHDTISHEILPQDILYRRKDAFSDAVSSKTKSWYKSLQELIEPLISNEELSTAYIKYPDNTPKTKEALYYRNIFAELFPNRCCVIPHLWLPKWVDTNDPSATILKVYKND